jgi:hypothetical protein
MRRSTLMLFVGLLMLPALDGRLSAQARIQVKLQGKPEELEVTVKSWRMKVIQGESMWWTLSDPHGLVGAERMKVTFAVCGDNSAPTFTQVDPITFKAGPFEQLTPSDLEWCKYNIVIDIADEDEPDLTIDPDYRVDPPKRPPQQQQGPAQ